MSWIFGAKKSNPPDFNSVLDAPMPPGVIPPPPTTPTNSQKKQMEQAFSAFRFDSAALERAAKAAKELESSKHAKEALNLAKMQEQTQQMEFQSKVKEYEAGIEQLKVQQTRVIAEERRKTLEEEAKIQKNRVDYQEMLAKKRHDDQLQQQMRMHEETLRKQEESVQKQEQMRRNTIEYEAQLRHENEMKKIQAKLKGEAQIERENKEIRLEKARMEAREYRETVLESIKTFSNVFGAGFNVFLEDKDKVFTAVGAVSLLAAGIYSAKFGLRATARIIENRIGKPSLVRDTSRLNFVDIFRHPITTISRMWRKPQDPLTGIILRPVLESNLRRIAIATRHTKSNNGFYRNVLLAGPPGTGKTMFAKNLAAHSGLDYAILTGGDIAPLAGDGVTAIHKVFDWAKTSRKGVLVFVDEADAFLRKREQEHISEGIRATLNAFLYRTGEQSKNCMLILASNQPEQFDWAINDRMDEIIEFNLPDLKERERIIRHYFDLYLLRPSQKKSQRIILDDTIDYAVKCHQVANKTEHFSGRELSKLAIAWQAAAFSSEDGVLTEVMMDQIVQNAIESNKKKRIWRHQRISTTIYPSKNSIDSQSTL